MTLLGKFSSGEFKTASKKAYPSSLCRSIATAIVDSVTALVNGRAPEEPGSQDHELPEEQVYPQDTDEIRAGLMEFYVSRAQAQPDDDVTPYAPDFAGRPRSRGARTRVDPERRRFLDSDSSGDEEAEHSEVAPIQDTPLAEASEEDAAV